MMSFRPQIAHSLVAADSIRLFAGENWDIAPAEAFLLQSGFNDTYLLKSATEAWIFRLYRINRWSHEALEEELAASLQLHDTGIRVAAPLAARDGTWSVKMECPEGTRWAALFPRIEGEMPFPPSEVPAARHGKLLAEIHQSFFGSRFQHRWILGKETLLTRPLAWLTTAFPHRQNEITEMGKRLDFGDMLSPGNEEIQRIHGDFVYMNLIAKDETTTVIDFDLSGNGSPLYDLACYHWSVGAHLSGPELSSVWESFLAGYRTVRPITFDDGVVERLALWRQLWTWAVNVEGGTDFRRLIDRSFDHHSGKLLQAIDALKT